jgi:hypothetical protein
LDALAGEELRPFVEFPVQSELFVPESGGLHDDLPDLGGVKVRIGLGHHSADLGDGVVGFRFGTARLAAEFAVPVAEPGVVLSAALDATVAVTADLGRAGGADAVPVAVDRGQRGGLVAVGAARAPHVPGTMGQQVVDELTDDQGPGRSTGCQDRRVGKYGVGQRPPFHFGPADGVERVEQQGLIQSRLNLLQGGDDCTVEILCG